METYPSSIATLVSSALLLVASALAYIFFIVSSLSIARSRTARLEELVEEGTFGASGGQKILERSDAYLLYTQVGRFLSSTGAGFCLAFLMHDIAHLFSERGTGGAYGAILAVVVFGTFILLTLVGVQIAKSLSLQYPERCLTRVSSVLRATYPLFGPIVLFLHTAVSRVLSRFQVRLINERELAVSADDISEIVKMSSEVGSIEQNEMELIEGVVELSERVVREVMTPRTDVVWVRETARLEEIVRTCTEEAVSRVLVCGSDLDEVRGIFLSKDLLRFVGHQVAPDAWKPFIRPAHFVPNTKAVDELLVEMRERGIHLAIVLDEHGGVDGVVTLEDLVEEIVGEIFDEFDAPSEEQRDVLERDGALLVDGAVPIEVLKEDYGIELPEGNYDTVAGFVLAHLGRVPNTGEAFGVDGIEFHILEVDKQRVARVSIRRVLPLAPNESEAASPLLAANGTAPSAQLRTSGPRSLRISEAS
jgi:putative hemolysin